MNLLNKYDDDEDETPLEPFEADIVDAAGRPIMMHLLTDDFINTEVLLDVGDSAALARVVRQAVDSDGKVIGKWNSNPILNTLVCECGFNDGTIKEYAANIIAFNIYEEGDANGFSSDDLTRIHTLRKCVGQAKDRTSVETVRAKQ